MPTAPPAGPYELVDIGLAEKAPLYIISFDEHGVCTSPQTRAALVADAAGGGFTNLFLFSHGWNNDFPTAIGRYREFFQNFRRAREGAGPGFPARYKPLLVGVFWPSTALVFGDERGPDIAAAPAGEDPARDAALGSVMREVAEIATVLPPEQRPRFYELVTAPALSNEDAIELAGLLLPQIPAPSPEEQAAPDVTPNDLVMLWRQLASEVGDRPPPSDDEEDSGAFGNPGEPVRTAGAAPQTAGLLSMLDPRHAVRLFTVFQMKDRAGRVGTVGVSPLLRDLIAAAPAVRTHLVGHSYGCKVLLSAICAGQPIAAGAVTSVLLLQPAINFWCFAANVDGEHFPGGYRAALQAVKQPLLCTFSAHDFALRRTFHLVLTRKGDLGEVKTAGLIEPDRYGGLGGWGPRGCPAPEGLTLPMPAAGVAYPTLTAPTPRVIGLDGEQTIDGHGNVATKHTAWALLQQVLAS